MKLQRVRYAFTLIEIVIAVGILALIAGAVIAAINPSRQFAQARNTQRIGNITAIASAIGNRMAEQRGVFEKNCAAGAIPTTEKKIASGTGNYDIAECLVPTYLPSLPIDPSAAEAHYTSNADYNTGYTVVRDAASGRITLRAPSAELAEMISVTR